MRLVTSLLVIGWGATACQPDYLVTAIPPGVDEPLEDQPMEEDPEGVDTVQTPQEDAPELVDDPPPEDDCEDTSDSIYVISRGDDNLYLFDPVTLSFDLLGRLDCTMWGEPGSMGIARDGYAYVRYSDQTVYEVDLVTMECEEMPYNDPGFGAFGMGYATDNAQSWRDQLYVANEDSLALLDTSDWSLERVGNIPSQAELTGNGDGDLFAFLPLEVPAEIRTLDKQTGATLDIIELQQFPNPYDIDTFAFATWGSDFWLFVRSYGMGNSTDVYRVTGNQMFLEIEGIGFALLIESVPSL
jgi:hypothetical protein